MNVESTVLWRGARAYAVLIGNDRVRAAEPDCWKYKVIEPYATWSLGFDTRQEALDAALADILSDL